MNSSLDDEEYDYLDDQMNLNLLDKIYKYCMPTLATIAFLLRLLCIFIFVRINSTSKLALNNYLLVNSVTETIVSFSYGPFSILNRMKSSYLSKLMHIIFVIYFSNVAGMISSIVNLLASIDRLILIKNITTVKDISFKHKLLITLCFSFLIHFPYVFEVEINKVEPFKFVDIGNDSSPSNGTSELKQQIVYIIGHSNFSQEIVSRILIHSVSFIRYIIINLLMLGLNLWLAIEAFKLAAKRRELLKINNKSCQLLIQKYSTTNEVTVTSSHSNMNINNSRSDRLEISGISRNGFNSSMTNLATNLNSQSSHNFLSPSPSTSLIDKRKFSVQVYTNPIKTLFAGKMTKTEWNLTLMTLIICFFYLIELNFICFSYYYLLFNKMSSIKKITLEIITSNIIQIVNLIEILTYFIFNSLFRNELKNVFKFEIFWKLFKKSV